MEGTEKFPCIKEIHKEYLTYAIKLNGQIKNYLNDNTLSKIHIRINTK